MSSKCIVIDLSLNNQNRGVKSLDDLIQYKAFEALSLQIRKDLNNSKSVKFDEMSEVELNNKDLYPVGSGLTYFIDGTRGAGKSTFLNFAYENLNKFENKEVGFINVAPLLYLDPSRIESSEIILLHILKQLKRLMENRPQYGNERIDRYEGFRKNFKEMAGGLHLFVSGTDSLKDLDSELFLDYGLDRAADSQKLRRVLHDTIDQVCNAYKCEALLLAIDDADTKFHNAIEVLECIRKYLDMPKIVVLVTGDMEMYSLLVQNHFQKDFAAHEKGLNQDRKVQQARMVAHLEEQYLLKLFPINRRIQLRTLYTLLDQARIYGDNEFKVKISQSDLEIRLITAVEDIAIEGLYLRDNTDLKLFAEHVLKQPIRSVIQLVTMYYQAAHSGLSKREAAAIALRATALSSLYRHDIDVDSIAEGDLHALINAAFDLCQLDGEPDTAIYLRPQSRDDSLRNSNISLAADIARLSENDPSKAITYMVSMAGSSTILHLVSAKSARRSSSKITSESISDDSLQRKVKQYLSVGRKDNALNWSWHATAAIGEVNSSSGMRLKQGVIGVRTSRKGDVTTFDAQVRAAIESSAEYYYPAIAFCQSAVKKSNSTQRYLSIFNTLGVISNLLEIEIPNSKNIKPRDVLEIYNPISKILNKIEHVQTVSMPNWGELHIRDDDVDSDANRYEYYFDNQKKMKSVHAVSMWLKICKEIKKEFRPSAVLMGKIWNRLYFSLDNISAAMRSEPFEKSQCHKSMELFAWALINACLVEEIDYHHRKKDKSKNVDIYGIALNRENPKTSGQVVMEKFSIPPKGRMEIRLNIAVEMAPLTFMIASCPLVLGLIKHEKNSEEFLKNISVKLSEFCACEPLPPDLLCSQVVWDLIGRTTVAG